MATVNHVVACDYVGIVSGNKEPNKFEKAGFTAIKSEFVNAPIIEQLPMSLECELVSYDEESCYMVGKIVNVSVEESVVTENNKIDIQKLQPITYDPVNHDYITLGAKAGNAFADGKKLK
jgi:flavin reductase (DIM6/NTAB) family NADH-FMN oxidoreductase RutF